MKAGRLTALFLKVVKELLYSLNPIKLCLKFRTRDYGPRVAPGLSFRTGHGPHAFHILTCHKHKQLKHILTHFILERMNNTEQRCNMK